MRLFLLLTALLTSLPLAAQKVEITSARLNLLVKNLEERQAEAYKTDAEKKPAVAIVVAQYGKQLISKSYPNSFENFDEHTPLPIGNASYPLFTLALASMESESKIKLSRKADSVSSLFQLKDGALMPTLEDLIAMRAALHPQLDILLPKDASADEIFSIIRQYPRMPVATKPFAFSKVSLAAGAYLCTIEEGAGASNILFLDEYKKLMNKYLFEKAGFTDFKYLDDPAFVKYTDFKDSPFRRALLPADGVALSVSDISKWMVIESGKGVLDAKKIADANFVEYRWVPLSDRYQDFFSLGFADPKLCKEQCMIAMFKEYGTSGFVAIVPRQEIAFAIIVSSTDSKALYIAQGSLKDFFEMIESALSGIRNRKTNLLKL